MLSPTPLSLLCALLLCLPLAIVFTITTPPTPHSSTTSSSASHLHISAGATTSRTSRANKSSTAKQLKPLSALQIPPQKARQRLHNTNTTSTATRVTRPTIIGREAAGIRNETVDDDAEDDSLFQLASRVNSNPKPSVKKLAFMFLTTTPLPFAPLWELFFNSTPQNLYNIYIHADLSLINYTAETPPFRGLFAGRVIPSKPTRRHSPTLIAAARRLLSRALLHDESNYMFALLSPSCIPLHSFNFTYRVLTKSRKSFIEILKDEPGAYDRWAARGEDAMPPEVEFEDFRIGSQFFTLKREHARIVVSDRRLWSKFKLPCLRLDTCYPEEHYFPTLLRMVDPQGIVPATLTHVDWRGGHGGHPRMYREEEVGTELIRVLRKRKIRYGTIEEGSSSNITDATSYGSVKKRRDYKRHHPFLFARKFCPECIGRLMDTAKDVIFKD